MQLTRHLISFIVSSFKDLGNAEVLHFLQIIHVVCISTVISYDLIETYYLKRTKLQKCIFTLF